MKLILCTCPGRFGDIFWALASARQAYLLGGEVDFGIMGKYERALPFIKSQSYIRDAFPVPGWVEVHSNWGSQPWESPSEKLGYEKVYDFGYREAPGVQLIDYASSIYPELKLDPGTFPFLQMPHKEIVNCVPYHFSPHQGPHGGALVEKLRRAFPEKEFVDTGGLPFIDVAKIISGSRVFLGSRSSNYVIAQGLGKPCVILELAGYRRHPKYANSYGKQIMTGSLDFKFFVDGIREAFG